LGHFSGHLTSAQRFTIRDQYIVGVAKRSAPLDKVGFIPH